MIPEFIDTAIDEALSLLPDAMTSPEAKIMLYSIGLQESRFKARFQVVSGNAAAKGPARGFWQFERLGGCKGVVSHPASRYWMSSVCKARSVVFNATAVWNAIETDDVLAAAAARLLLFTDPKRLPAIGEPKEAWNLYKRVWRPGKPHPETWPDFYAESFMRARL